MQLPSGQTIPDQVGAFFEKDHQHPGGFDLHPEFRPWAQRNYYNIYSVAPMQLIAPPPILAATKSTRPTAARDLAPQIPEDASY